MSRNFYIAVTQQVFLFGAESWVLTGKMEAALDAFQGRVARRLTGRLPRRGRDGKWQYLPLAGAIKDAVIVRERTSVLRRHNTVAQFVATRPILDLCEGTELHDALPSLFQVLKLIVVSCPHRGPESAALQRIARPYSVSG